MRFGDAVRTLLADDPSRILVEVGPGTTASALVRKQLDPAAGRAVIALGRGPKDPRGEGEIALDALGQLWLAGAAIEWTALYPGERRQSASRCRATRSIANATA